MRFFSCSVMWYYYGSANTFSAYFLICCFHSVSCFGYQLPDAVFFFGVLDHTKINNSCTFDVPWPFPSFFSVRFLLQSQRYWLWFGRTTMSGDTWYHNIIMMFLLVLDFIFCVETYIYEIYRLTAKFQK